MKQFIVYILKCSDDSYYIGVTAYLERRLRQHASAKTGYVSERRPFELVFTKRFDRPRKAIAFEKQLKGWTRKKKEALVQGDIFRLKQLASCRNETHYSRVKRAY